MNRGIWALVLLVICLALAGSALAQTSDDLYSKAESLWARRDVLDNTLQAIDIYDDLVKKNPDDLKARICLARAAYWLSEMEPKEVSPKERVKILRRGMAAIKEVVNKEPDNVAGRYLLMRDSAAINTLESIFDFNLAVAIIGTIYVAKGDVNYDFGGIYRYWGEVIYNIPGLLGKFFNFTIEDEIYLFKQSQKIEPKFFKSTYFLARSYIKKKDKQAAKSELEKIVNANPEDLAGYEAENRFYQGLARKMMEGL